MTLFVFFSAVPQCLTFSTTLHLYCPEVMWLLDITTLVVSVFFSYNLNSSAYFIFCFGSHVWQCSGLIPTLSSKIIPGECGVPNGRVGIELWLSRWKANAFPLYYYFNSKFRLFWWICHIILWISRGQFSKQWRFKVIKILMLNLEEGRCHYHDPLFICALLLSPHT